VLEVVEDENDAAKNLATVSDEDDDGSDGFGDFDEW